MHDQLQFDTYLYNSTSVRNFTTPNNPPVFSGTLKNVSDYGETVHTEGSSSSISIAPIAVVAAASTMTLAIIYILTKDVSKNGGQKSAAGGSSRSTPLPGYGIMGDKVNEVIELFLDALAVYVHNDNKWECQRRMLCEANQRAGEYGVVQGVVMYFLSLAVSLLLQNQRVSDSLEAMKSGRRGGDCAQLYSKCPFSL